MMAVSLNRALLLLSQSVYYKRFVILPVFWFCLFRYAWNVQLKDRTLGKSVYFNTANFHSMANFTFVSKCFSLPNYTISLPATQPFSQSAVKEPKKKKIVDKKMIMNESIQSFLSKSRDLDSSSAAVGWEVEVVSSKTGPLKIPNPQLISSVLHLNRTPVLTLILPHLLFNHQHENVEGSMKLSALHFLVYEPSIRAHFGFL